MAPPAARAAAANVALYSSSLAPFFDPLSPAADTDGMVKGSDVDLGGETATQLVALRFYHAHLAVLRTADALAGKRLDLVG